MVSSTNQTRDAVVASDTRRAGGSGGLARAGALVAVVIGAIHLVEAPEYLEAQPYLGVLFIVGGVALVVAAAGLLWNRRAAASWWLGALVCAGMLVGGILSRTTGLPSFFEEEWEPLLLVSLALELAFLVLCGLGRRRAR